VPTPVKAEPPVGKARANEPPVNAESRQMYQQALTALGAGPLPEAERALLAVIAVSRNSPPGANLGISTRAPGTRCRRSNRFSRQFRLNPDRRLYYNESAW